MSENKSEEIDISSPTQIDIKPQTIDADIFKGGNNLPTFQNPPPPPPKEKK